jgi:predicted regulator of Ras-like GTPase activity (Roadblock/LC7/MglB family)
MSDHLSSRAARLDRALTDLLTQAPELEAAAVVSFDGLAMASALPDGMDEDRVAAMSAALLSLGEKAAQGLGRGDLSQVYVEGETGTVFLVSADDEAVLVAVAAAGAKAGLMLYEVRRSAAVIAEVLRTEAPPAAAAVDEAALADAEAAYAAHKAAQAAVAAPEQAVEQVAEPVVAQIEPIQVEPIQLVPAHLAAVPELVDEVVPDVVPEPVAAEVASAVEVADTPIEAPAAPDVPAASSPVVMPVTHSTAPGPRTGTFFPEVTAADLPPVPDTVPEALAEASSLSLAPWETPPQESTWS